MDPRQLDVLMAMDARADHSASSNSLGNQAYRAVTDLIRTRRVRGGEVIVESRLADLLGISRTPLREALQRLEGEGLIVKNQSRSFAVRRVELAEYLHSLKVRELLEGEAAMLAAGRVPEEKLVEVKAEIEQLAQATTYHTTAHWQSDDNLHDLLADGCGNPVMAKMIRSLRVTTRLFEISQLADRVGPDSDEHRRIVEALEQDNPRAARKALQLHIKSLARFAMQTVI